MSDKIRILYIVPSLRLCNGVASYAMNYFRNIDKDKFQIDFITGVNEESVYYDEIKNAGSQIYYIPKMGIKNIIEVRKKIKKFLKENATKYDIIHCHVLNMGAFYLYYAKKYGIKIRILHSHATQYADKFINNIRNTIFSVFSKKFANTYFACSKLAGDFMFKNKKYTVCYLVIILMASIPLFNNYLIRGHDIYFHLMRIEGLAQGLGAGEFPVRIQPAWYDGYGYAVSVFYSDLFLYPAALLIPSAALFMPAAALFIPAAAVSIPSFAEVRPAASLLMDSCVVPSFRAETLSFRAFSPFSSCCVPDISDCESSVPLVTPVFS